MSRAQRTAQLLVGEFRLSPWRTARVARPSRRVLVGRGFRVRGARKIVTSGRLELGLMWRGFADPRMGGLLRVRGALTTRGVVQIGHGCRVDVGPLALVAIGPGTYFSPDVQLVSTERVTIGAGCAIGWGTQILDDGFHTVTVDGKPRPRGGSVEIGDRVWIGSRCTVLPGTRIADGCVVAAGSVVRGVFDEPGSLIAGNPARVVRKGIDWS